MFVNIGYLVFLKINVMSFMKALLGDEYNSLALRYSVDLNDCWP